MTGGDNLSDGATYQTFIIHQYYYNISIVTTFGGSVAAYLEILRTNKNKS